MNRRRFLQQASLAGGGLLLAGSPFQLLAAPRRGRTSPPPLERLYLSMGTVVRFQVYHADEDEARAAVREASALIQQAHNLMSVQDPTSELARWNRAAEGMDRPFHPLTAAALDEALEIHAATDGRLDPTVGAAVSARRQGRPPVPQPDRLGRWDAANRRLEKTTPRVELDLGGSAKGWAIDRAAGVLRRRGVSAALINAGGDLRVIGAPPEAAAWQIGLRDPRAPDEVLGTLSLRNAAVATSGDYERDGSTLVDPRDLSRVRLRGSVSVVADTCGRADGLATACSVEPDLALLPPGARGLIARRREGRFAIDHTPDLDFAPL